MKSIILRVKVSFILRHQIFQIIITFVLSREIFWSYHELQALVMAVNNNSKSPVFSDHENQLSSKCDEGQYSLTIKITLK